MTDESYPQGALTPTLDLRSPDVEEARVHLDHHLPNEHHAKPNADTCSYCRNWLTATSAPATT